MTARAATRIALAAAGLGLAAMTHSCSGESAESPTWQRAELIQALLANPIRMRELPGENVWIQPQESYEEGEFIAVRVTVTFQIDEEFWSDRTRQADLVFRVYGTAVSAKDALRRGSLMSGVFSTGGFDYPSYCRENERVYETLCDVRIGPTIVEARLYNSYGDSDRTLAKSLARALVLHLEGILEQSPGPPS